MRHFMLSPAQPLRCRTALWAAAAASVACHHPNVPLNPDGGSASDAGVLSWDLGLAFSPTVNPNGPWRYGYTAGATLAGSAFQLDGDPVQVASPEFWHPSTSQYYPYVAGNPDASTITDATDSWALRAGEVAMEGSASAQYSVVQFVIPDAGSYAVQANFEGIHFRLSTTDVHVLQNDVPLFDANIDGYGGDPAFHAIEGTSPDASYAGLVAVDAGDVLTFAVGIGVDQTNYNDTTGLRVHITLVP
jgi:hypothetical protein